MLSPAQHLPEVILKRIFEYLVRRDICVSYSYGPSILELVNWPITRVCHEWRQVGINFVYKAVTLDSFGKLLTQLIVALGVVDKVKAVTLMLETDDIFTGSALSKLASPPVDGTVFGAATRLYIQLFGEVPATDGQVELYSDNARKLCSEIQRMVPAATRVRVYHGWNSTLEPWPSYAFDLLDGLFAGKTGIDTVDTKPKAASNIFANCGCLQSIEANNQQISLEFLQVICRNAPTLQTLDVELTQPHLAMKLITDADGAPIVYPRLHTLALRSFCDYPTFETSLLDTPGGTPFPALEKLIIHVPYLFGNDVLLRGSEKSLRVLDMHVSHEMLDTLSRCGVFDKGRFKALDYLNMRNWNFPSDWVTESQGVRVFDAFCTTSVLNLGLLFDLPFDRIEPYIDDFSRTLRVLNTPSLSCTLEQVVTLIQSLPLLQSLAVECIRSDVLEDESDHVHDDCTGICKKVTADKDIDTIYSHANAQFVESHVGIACQTMSAAGVLMASRPPISQRLLRSQVYLEWGCSPMHRIRLAAILAIMCPSIRQFGTEAQPLGECADRSTFANDPYFNALLARTRVNIDEQ